MGAHGVAAIQPMCLLDTIVEATDASGVLSVLSSEDLELGGSHRIPREEMERLLSSIQATTATVFKTPGGSAANVLRGLARGHGVHGCIIGCCGSDAGGELFSTSIKAMGIDTSGLHVCNGTPTGQCLVLNYGRNRTMRTCFDGCERLTPAQVAAVDLSDVEWVFCAGYCLYIPGLLEAIFSAARRAGKRVAFDLGSFEVVRAHHAEISRLLAARYVDCVFCNEDEAQAFLDGFAGSTAVAQAAQHQPGLHARSPTEAVKPEAQLDSSPVVHGTALDGGAQDSATRAACLLSCLSGIVVVTRGAEGCTAARAELDGGNPRVLELHHVPAVPVRAVVDTTGAGDHFAAGALCGLLRGRPLLDCARIGCATGAACVQAIGAQLTDETAAWLRATLDEMGL